MIYQRLEKFKELIQKCICSTDEYKIKIEKAFSLAKALLEHTKKHKTTVYIIGNNQVASKICTDFIKNLKIAASTLLDSNLLISISSEYGYENSYVMPLKVLLKENDLLIAMSNSGQSPNVLNAAYYAKRKNIKIITLSGFSSLNPLCQVGDLNFWFNSSDQSLIEMSYSFILHTIITLYDQLSLEKKLCSQV